MLKLRIESQEKGFEIGFSLVRLGLVKSNYAIRTENKFIYVYENGIVSYGMTEKHFNEHPSTETTLEELKAM